MEVIKIQEVLIQVDRTSIGANTLEITLPRLGEWRIPRFYHGLSVAGAGGNEAGLMVQLEEIKFYAVSLLAKWTQRRETIYSNIGGEAVFYIDENDLLVRIIASNEDFTMSCRFELSSNSPKGNTRSLDDCEKVELKSLDSIN